MARGEAITPHQYIDRRSGEIVTERIFADRTIQWLYSPIKENAPLLFKALTGKSASSLLAYLNYDNILCSKLTSHSKFIKETGINLSECLDNPEKLSTPRAVFERKIRYWETRPI